MPRCVITKPEQPCLFCGCVDRPDDVAKLRAQVAELEQQARIWRQDHIRENMAKLERGA